MSDSQDTEREERAIVFETPADTPSVNETAGAHWGKHRAVKVAWQDAAYFYAVQHFGAVGPEGRQLPGRWLVRLGLSFPVRRRRDPHNYVGTVVKWTVDGLVQAGLWPDDTPEFVQVAEPVVLKSKKLVVVQLVPIPPEFDAEEDGCG